VAIFNESWRRGDLVEFRHISAPFVLRVYGQEMPTNLQISLPLLAPAGHIITRDSIKDIEYLQGLQEIFSQQDNQTFVMGDFNQRIPRKYSRQDVYDLMMKTFEDFKP